MRRMPIIVAIATCCLLASPFTSSARAADAAKYYVSLTDTWGIPVDGDYRADAPIGFGTESIHFTSSRFGIAGLIPGDVMGAPDWGLNRITSLGYWAKHLSSDTAFESTAHIEIHVDLDGDNYADTSLVYNPRAQPGASVIQDKWQYWDAMAGLFASSQAFGSGDSALARNGLYRLADVQAWYPSATAQIMYLNAYSYWGGNADVLVDGLTLGSRLFDFERVDPADTSETDTDGDGFFNYEEVRGVTVGSSTVDLHALGADPQRKDIFLKLDYLKPKVSSTKDATTSVNYDLRPTQADLEDLKHAFSIAPTTDELGINLHVSVMDPSEEYRDAFGTGTKEDAYAKAIQLRANRLNPAEEKVFLYGIIVPWLYSDAKGFSSTSGVGADGGTFVVARRPSPQTWLSGRGFRGTLMHELGHTLGLDHGGSIDLPDANVNCKPGYTSVMNYTYQLSGVNGEVRGIDYYRGGDLTLPAPQPPVVDCPGTPVPTASYRLAHDWSNLNLREGGGSTLAGGSSVGVVLPNEPTFESFKNAGLLAFDGNASGSLVAPAVLLRGSGATTQRLVAQVHNFGLVAADYEVALHGPFFDGVTTTRIGPDSSVDIAFDVPTSALPAAGDYPFLLNVQSGQGGLVSTVQQYVTVMEPLGAELREIQELLATGALQGLSPMAVAGLSQAVAGLGDTTPPVIEWSANSPQDGQTFTFGSLGSLRPSCTATDAGDGIDSPSCLVSGYSLEVGTHVLTASAKDKAGNETTQTRSYTVNPWTLKGFYQPVDMNGTWNTVKGGATVPLKFEVFAGPTVLTDTGVVTSFAATKINCTTAQEDAIESLATSGGTSLRYDTTASQFIQNWQTPKSPGSCYEVTMTTNDGSSLRATFKLK